jgi:hypothetical protein
MWVTFYLRHGEKILDQILDCAVAARVYLTNTDRQSVYHGTTTDGCAARVCERRDRSNKLTPLLLAALALMPPMQLKAG